LSSVLSPLPLGTGVAGPSPSVLLSTGATAARDEQSVGEPWVQEEASGDTRHRRNWSPRLSPCHVIKLKRDALVP